MNEITTEMRINDLIYKIIDDELDDMIYDCDELDKEFEKLYFAKRVLSVFQNNDMPIRAAVGLLDNVDIIEALYEDKDEYIGDSDSDTKPVGPRAFPVQEKVFSTVTRVDKGADGGYVYTLSNGKIIGENSLYR